MYYSYIWVIFESERQQKLLLKILKATIIEKWFYICPSKCISCSAPFFLSICIYLFINWDLSRLI